MLTFLLRGRYFFILKSDKTTSSRQLLSSFRIKFKFTVLPFLTEITSGEYPPFTSISIESFASIAFESFLPRKNQNVKKIPKSPPHGYNYFIHRKLEKTLDLFLKNLHYFLYCFVLVTAFYRIRNASPEVIFQYNTVCFFKSRLNCLGLMQNIYTINVLFSHFYYLIQVPPCDFKSMQNSFLCIFWSICHISPPWGLNYDRKNFRKCQPPAFIFVSFSREKYQGVLNLLEQQSM